MPEAVLTGVETRSSSPIKILRDEQFESPVKGIFPCGEGAGYAGGIVSAAVDGLKAALSTSAAESKTNISAAVEPNRQQTCAETAADNHSFSVFIIFAAGKTPAEFGRYDNRAVKRHGNLSAVCMSGQSQWDFLRNQIKNIRGVRNQQRLGHICFV